MKKKKKSIAYYVGMILPIYFMFGGVTIIRIALNKPEICYMCLSRGIIYFILGAVIVFSGIMAFKRYRKRILNQPTFHYLCCIMPIAIVVHGINCLVDFLLHPNLFALKMTIINIVVAIIVSLTAIYTLREYRRIT